MKFDFIIGNPPYQESDGGAGVSATPVYNRFISAVKTLDPEVMCLIVPAKWYSGGKGLDNFRKEMLSDSHIARLVDYTNSLDVFPNVDVAGGVCIFIRDKKHNGPCSYTNYFNGVETTTFRKLNEFATFVRYPLGASVIAKVLEHNEKCLDEVVSSRKPFGLPTTTRPLEKGDITIRCNGGKGPYERSLVKVGVEMIDKWKVIISRLTAEHAGQPDKSGQFRVLSTMEMLQPSEICSETYLVAGSFDTKEEAENYMDYLKTRFSRFLLVQIAITQQLSKSTFAYVPIQDFTRKWTDEELFAKYGLNEEERDFVCRMVKEMN